ncbi:LysR family transcriptional regulator [Cohnella soli]|uniref:LysR family transcriptional regulator n=1 Tax=Cohnella soli TaxID=425005 RepID=A0ABW0I242_9BACL
MDFVYLKSFLEVAKCRSFTKAAENLGYVQSSVTAQIQKLENEYGVVLFERYGRSMRLTSAGEQLRVTFEKIIELYDDSLLLVSRLAKGNIEIGTIDSLMSFFLPPILHQLSHSYPDMNLQVHTNTATIIMQSLRSGMLDMGIVIDALIEDDDIEAITIRREPLVLVAKPDHPLVSSPQFGLEGLDGQYLIVTEQGCSYRTALEDLLSRCGVNYHVSHEFNNLEAIKQFVGYGLGIALVPQIVVVRELMENKLAALPFSHPDITFYSQIVYHKKKWLNPAIRCLIELLLDAGDQRTTLPATQIS